jgi:hypothetical protein
MTVREYYQQLDPTEGLDNLEVIGFGHFQEFIKPKLATWPYWGDLIEELCKVVVERGDMPHRGGPTCASIMEAAKTRYLVSKGAKWSGGQRGHWENISESKKVPGAWIRTITELQKLPLLETE